MPWSLRMVLYASIILCLILLYFSFRYFRSVKITGLQPGWFYKTLFFIPAGLFLAYPAAGLTEFWFQGSFSRTGYPDILIYLFWYGLVFTGVMFNWLLLHDILLPFSKRFLNRTEKESRQLFARAFLVITGFTAVYTGAKMVWDTHRITAEKIYYTLPDTDSSFGPLTVVHIADLHADSYTDDAILGRYVRKVNEFQPDIVLFAGDLITSGTGYIEKGAAALGKIESTYGVYAVLGDHDYWTDTEFIVNELKTNGIPVLQNENRWIEHNGSLIKISGITEIYSNQVQPDALDALLNESRGESLALLASHQATDRLINRAKEAGVHQLLGGHTHGGQIRIPVFFYPVTAARAETKYVNGNWMFGNMLLNINNGLGFTLSPVRYNAPAQVSVIRVNAKGG
jgi:uncharacterized protein